MQIIGYEKEKKALNELKEMLLNSKEYLNKGVRIPKGLILVGEPGVGKSKLARSIVSEGLTLVELKASDVTSDENLDAIISSFDEAKKKAPSILLMDEIDKIAGLDSQMFMETSSKVHNVLLEELDKVNPIDRILVIGTCNDIHMLSDAMTRPGRFDRIINIDLPDTDTRKEILKSYFSNLKHEIDLDFDEIARMTVGASGADIERLVNEVGIYAITNKVEVITSDIVRKVQNSAHFRGFEKKVSDDETVRWVAIHEAGHAFMGYLLKPNAFYSATVIPQGNSGGHMQIFEKEKNVRKVSDIENGIKIVLSGHIAERVFIGEYLTGSHSDLNQAYEIMKHMIMDGAYEYENFMELASSMDQMRPSANVRKFIGTKFKEFDCEIEKILNDNHDKFLKIVDVLIKDKVIDKEMMDKIMGDEESLVS